MNKNYFYISLCLLLTVISCKKETVNTGNIGFVKLISTEEEISTVACIPTADDQFIVVGRSFENISQGWIVKLNQRGEELWRKLIPQSNKVLWNAFPLQGGGFITYGWENMSESSFNVIKYDDAGNAISTYNVALPWPNNGCSAPDLIQLKNGNYMFATSANGAAKGYIIVANSTFDVLSTEVYSNIQPGYDGCYIRGLCQINDSTIGFSASASVQVSSIDAFTNSMLITADLNGVMRTITFLQDSIQSETTNFLGVNNNGMLNVTSSMNGYNSGEGIYVNYQNNTIAEFISGRINLLEYDLLGNLQNRNKIYSYPKNGVISRGKLTKDGGFILVGTVNQNNKATIDANTQIFMLKIDANFNEQWSKVFDTIYPSYGIDVIETNEGGYFVAGYQLNNNTHFNMLVMKTDELGNIK